MLRETRRIALLAAAAAFVLASGPLGAQNLVRNGSFNSDVSDWPAEDTSAQVSWSPLDASGSASSGSALVANVSAGPSNGIGIHQCLSGAGIVPGATYTYGGKARIAAGQARTGFVMFGLRWYTSADCSGDAEDQPRIDTRTLDAWVSLQDVSVAPEGARSVEVLAFPSKAEAGGELHALFDDIFLLPRVAVLTIPSSASIHGASETFFHTDLWVMNLSRTNTQTVSARYRCFRGQTCSADSRTITLPARASSLLRDVVGDFFGSPETAGAIELSYDTSLGEVAATSRTYTPSLPAPTAGAAVPATGAAAARTRAVFLGLGSNERDLTSGFRTNAGVYNPSGSPVSVTFELFDEDGASQGTLTRTWEANEAYQVNDIFSAVGRGDAVTVNAYLVVTATAPVFPFVTVIDNQSGDFIWVTSFDDP
ncbi:MAG: hypothetical protein ACM3JH_04275 [Acidithiobacillales bacterium]